MPAPLIDPARIEESIVDDLESLREIVAIFVDTAPRSLAALGDAVARGDARNIKMIAHTMKSSVGTFAIPAVQAMAQQLEDAGGAGDVARAAAAYPAFKTAVERLADELVVFARERRAAS